MSFSFVSCQHNSCMQINPLKYPPIRCLKFYKENNHLATRWRSWLRQCATRRKVAGSIPYVITEIFHWHNPSSRTMAMVSTQPLREMCARNIFWVVKAAGAWDWQLYHLNVLPILKSGSLNLLDPSGPVQGLLCVAYFFFMWRYGPTRATGSHSLRFLDHTKRSSIVSPTPLDGWSARRRDFYLKKTEHSQQKNIHAPGGIQTRNISSQRS